MAAEVLERAIRLDRYAEEPYLDLDVETVTDRLYRSLTETDAHVGP